MIREHRALTIKANGGSVQNIVKHKTTSVSEQSNISIRFISLVIFVSSFFWMNVNYVYADAGYEPNSSAISGGGTFCESDALLLTATIGGFKCSNGGGGTNSTGTITWYSSTDNSNATPGDDTPVFSEPYATNLDNNTTWNYTPTVAGGSTGYFYYIITWSANGEAGCGSGTMTSAVAAITVTLNQIANAGADQSPSDCSTTVTLSGNEITDGGTGEWTVSPAGPTPQAPFTVNDHDAVFENLVAGTEYTFTWTSTNGGCSNADDMIFNSVGPGCVSYCTPTFTDPDDEYISNVSFGTINQSIGVGSYSDETGTCYDFDQGTTYTLDIDITMTGAWNNNVHAFFDWDADGTFEDDVDLGNLTGTGTIGTNITVPCDGVVGEITMRLFINEGATEPTPCTNGTYGDVADFCLNVIAAPVPVADAQSTYSACGTSATLDASASSIADGYWSIVSGSGTITDPSSQSTSITGLENGLTTLQWTSTGVCETDIAQTSFTVSGLPDEPVNAGVDAYTCLDPFTLDGSSTAPFNDPTDGFWSIVSEPGGSSASFSDVNDANSNITGLIAGTYVLQWNVVTDACGTVTDQVEVVFGSLPTPNAGADQSGLCPTGTTLDATPVDGVTGTWSQISGPSTAGFADVNDPTTQAFDLVAGTYVFQWEFSGGGCAGTTTDQVTIDVSSCTTAVTHDPINDQEFTGCSFTYTDDGGIGGNYSDNMNQTWTTFCPDDPNAYATITLTAESMLTYDYIVIYDDDAPGAPVVGGIWDGTAYPGLGTTITSSTGCLYVQANSNASSNSSGWEADIGCSATAGIQTQDYVQVNNCGGGGGITVCSSGPITAESNTNSNPPDLGNQNQGCLGSQEGASNTWVYINTASDGWISFELTPPGGQDYDYAIWGPYDGGYACPMITRDDPIRCSWASNGGAACNSVIGLGVENMDGDAVLASDVSEGGTCVPSSNEGWTYPIDANAGEVYVLLFQNYGNNNSTFDFALNNDPNSIPAGESFASLGCDPVTPLPIQLVSFEGRAVEEQNELEWITASETENDYFIIQKSKDAKTWDELTRVQGAGFSNESSYYETIDSSPYAQVTFYRLIQVDFDGTKRKHKTISVFTNSTNVFGELYPNPASSNFKFDYLGKDFKTNIEVTILNSLGEIVKETTFSDLEKSNKGYEVNTNNIQKGTYFVRLVQGEVIQIKRIVIF